MGPEAAANDEWAAGFFDLLVNAWRRTKGAPEVADISVSDGESDRKGARPSSD